MKIVTVNLHLSAGIGVRSSLVEEIKSQLETEDDHLDIRPIACGRDVSICPDVVSAIVYDGQPALIELKGEDVVAFVSHIRSAIASARQFDLVKGNGVSTNPFIKLPEFATAN